MSGAMKPGITVTIHEPVPTQPTNRLAELSAVLMSCRACGSTMVRGTQCDRCGAWCR